MVAVDTYPRDKLGVALAGGGFRASIFHIGVLRRLAKLDMLRYVEVISSVSGGSITAALYVLLLKRELEKSTTGVLSQDDYEALINQLEQRLLKGIQKNLRTRLFMNPFALIYLMFTGGSLGKRMARLYERFIYKSTVAELDSRSRPFWCSGRIRLHEIKIRPKNFLAQDDIESYNRRQVREQGSVITKLVLNATTLNTGTRFFFTASELGDYSYGYIREDEIERIIKIKSLIEPHSSNPLAILLKIILKGMAAPFSWMWRTLHCAQISRTAPGVTELSVPEEEVQKIYRWLKSGDNQDLSSDWQTMLNEHYDVGLLRFADMGLLRKARISAWYVGTLMNQQDKIAGGYNYSQHFDNLTDSLGLIWHTLPDTTKSMLNTYISNCRLLLFIEYVYLVRSAEIISWDIRKDWDELSLAQAVAISANFPPVFKPFRMANIFDDVEVSRLGLTDGGVFDNLGIYGLLDEHCSFIIASDTGKKMAIQPHIPASRSKMMFRIVDVLMEVDVKQTKHALLERYSVSSQLGKLNNQIRKLGYSGDSIVADNNKFLFPRELPELAIFHIDSPQVQHILEGRLQVDGITSSDLADIRTDLDGFGDIESQALINQGYINTDYYLKRYFKPGVDTAGQYINPAMASRYTLCDYPYLPKDFVWPDVKETSQLPKPGLYKLPQNKIRWALDAAKKRFFKWASPPAFVSPIYISWLITLGLIYGLISCTRSISISFQEISRYLVGAVVNTLQSMLPFMDKWANVRFSVGGVLEIVLIVLIIYLLVKFVTEKFRNKRKAKQPHTSIWRSMVRVMVRVVRWVSYLKDGVMAFAWVFVLSGVFIFIYFVYGLPYLWATRVKS